MPALGLRLSGAGSPWARRLWLLGAGAGLLHLAAGFHCRHHWSHAAAYADTAERTLRAVGVAAGAGLYLNYLFVLLWLADALWWTFGPAHYESRPRSVESLIQGYLAFIVFNAGVVFAVTPFRWAGVLATFLLAGLWARSMAADRLGREPAARMDCRPSESE